MNDLLIISLQAAVPLYIAGLKNLTPDERVALGQECGLDVAANGDLILYKSPKKGETARAHNSLAKGIACLAYQPGGVTYKDIHWGVDCGHLNGIRSESPCARSLEIERADTT